MANQPQQRNWLRLATLGRVGQSQSSAPGSTTTPNPQGQTQTPPGPRHPLLRPTPTFRPTTQPQPQPQPQPPPQSSQEVVPPTSAPRAPTTLTRPTPTPAPPPSITPAVVTPPSLRATTPLSAPAPPAVATQPPLRASTPPSVSIPATLPPPVRAAAPPSPPPPSVTTTTTTPAPFRVPIRPLSSPPSTNTATTVMPQRAVPAVSSPPSPNLSLPRTITNTPTKSSPESNDKPKKSPQLPTVSSHIASPAKKSPAQSPRQFAAAPKTPPSQPNIQSSPAKLSPALASPSKLPSPYPKQNANPSSTPVVRFSTASPKAANQGTPPQSPARSAVSPPSPLVLPPSQINESNHLPPEETKTVVSTRPVAQPKPPSESYAKPTNVRYFSDADDLDMKVITIAGENRGAIMELGYSPNRKNPHNYAITHNEGKLSQNEGPNMEGKHRDDNSRSRLPIHAVMNSNVQGINGSILFNSSLTHHDPGVHLSLSRKPVNGFGHNGHANGNRFL